MTGEQHVRLCSVAAISDLRPLSPLTPGSTDLADSYWPYGRALMVVDEAVLEIYGDAIRAYFDHHGIDLHVIGIQIRETAKSLETFERIIGEFDAFGLVRTEPVFV